MKIIDSQISNWEKKVDKSTDLHVKERHPGQNPF